MSKISKNIMRSYKIKSKPIISQYYKVSKTRVLRDEPIQKKYLNELYAVFFVRLMKAYAESDISDADRNRLRKLLEDIFEMKDAMIGKVPKGGLY